MSRGSLNVLKSGLILASILTFANTAFALPANNICNDVLSGRTFLSASTSRQVVAARMTGRLAFRTLDEGQLFRAAPVDPEMVRGFALARASDFAPNSYAGDFFQMSSTGRLMDQLDPRLTQRHPPLAFTDKGGICGPTCLLNRVIAGTAHEAHQRDPLDILADEETAYRRLTHHDSRMGVDPTAMERVASNLPEYQSVQIRGMGPEEMTSVQLSPVLGSSPANARNVLASSVTFPNGDGHAINILGISTTNRTVMINDPNYPDHVYWTPYRETVDAQGASSLEFVLVGQYSKDADITHQWVHLRLGYLETWPEANAASMPMASGQ